MMRKWTAVIALALTATAMGTACSDAGSSGSPGSSESSEPDGNGNSTGDGTGDGSEDAPTTVTGGATSTSIVASEAPLPTTTPGTAVTTLNQGTTSIDSPAYSGESAAGGTIDLDGLDPCTVLDTARLDMLAGEALVWQGDAVHSLCVGSGSFRELDAAATASDQTQVFVSLAPESSVNRFSPYLFPLDIPVANGQCEIDAPVDADSIALHCDTGGLPEVAIATIARGTVVNLWMASATLADVAELADIVANVIADA